MGMRAVKDSPATSLGRESVMVQRRQHKALVEWMQFGTQLGCVCRGGQEIGS